MRAVKGGFRSQTTRQAKREMVLCVMGVSSPSWPPAIVSVTTKSMGLSVERPIYKATQWSINIVLYYYIVSWFLVNIIPCRHLNCSSCQQFSRVCLWQFDTFWMMAAVHKIMLLCVCLCCVSAFLPKFHTADISGLFLKRPQGSTLKNVKKVLKLNKQR